MAFAAPSVGACPSTTLGKASSLPWSRLGRPRITATFHQVRRRPGRHKAALKHLPKAQLGQEGSGPPLAKPSKTALLRLPKAELEKELSARSLLTTGLKQELAERLLQALTQQQQQQQQQGPGQGEPSTSGQDAPGSGEGQPVEAEAKLKRLTKAELQERLVALGLPKTGKKEELVARLLAAATPDAKSATPQGREAAAAAGAASAAGALPAAPAGQPSSQGSGKGGERRGGRLPPVAAVVAKKHEKDEIPAYPPDSLDEEERMREALGPYAAMPERAPEADLLPSGVLEEDELSSLEASDPPATAPQPVAGWRWKKKSQAAAQPAAQASPAAEVPAAQRAAPAGQASQPAAAAGAVVPRSEAPPQSRAGPQAGEQPQGQQAERELQQAAETLKATGAGVAAAEEPGEPAGKEAAEEGDSQGDAELPPPAASPPSPGGRAAAVDKGTPQPVAGWRWKATVADAAGSGPAPPSEKAPAGGSASAVPQQAQQPAEAAPQTRPQAEDGATAGPQPVADWRWKPHAAGAAAAEGPAAGERQQQAGEGDKAGPQPVAGWRWKAGGSAAAGNPAPTEAAAAPAAAGAVSPSVSRSPAEAAATRAATSQRLSDEPASGATANPVVAAASDDVSPVPLLRQPIKPRPVAAWRWQGRQLPRASAAPKNAPATRAAVAADPAAAAAAQQPAQQQQQRRKDGAQSSDVGFAEERKETKEAVPPLVQAVAAATAMGEVSLEGAQLPTAETQALDDLMADIAGDVLSEAATAAAFAEGQETDCSVQASKAQQQQLQQREQQPQREAGTKAAGGGKERDEKAQVAASAAPTKAAPVAKAPAREALPDEQSQGAGPLGLLRVLSAAREGARVAGAMLDVVCRLVKGPK